MKKERQTIWTRHLAKEDIQMAEHITRWLLWLPRKWKLKPITKWYFTTDALECLKFKEQTTAGVDEDVVQLEFSRFLEGLLRWPLLGKVLAVSYESNVLTKLNYLWPSIPLSGFESTRPQKDGSKNVRSSFSHKRQEVATA